MRVLPYRAAFLLLLMFVQFGIFQTNDILKDFEKVLRTLINNGRGGGENRELAQRLNRICNGFVNLMSEDVTVTGDYSALCQKCQ